MRQAAALLLGSLALAATAPLAAQRLALGEWPVVLVMPDADSVRLTLTAARERERLRLAVTAPSGLAWGLGDIREDAARLRFSWALDGPTPMQCTLSYRRDEYWEGFCDDRVRGSDGKFLRLLLALSRAASATGPDTAAATQSRVNDSAFSQ